MVSDEPLPDRCGARCMDKLGVTITLGSDTVESADLVLTDETVRVCRFVNDPHDPDNVVEVRANYKSLRKWLWDDYVLDGIGLDPVVEFGETEQAHGPIADAEQLADTDGISGVNISRPPADNDLVGSSTYQAVELESVVLEDRDSFELEDLVWVDIDGECRHNVTNRYNELRGYCEQYPMHGEDWCVEHNTPSGEEMEGNDHAVDNRGNLKHGLYARRTVYYKAMDDDDQAFIESMVNSWLEQAPFDRDNAAKLNELYRIAIDQHRAMRALDEYVEEDELQGMTAELTIDYDPQEGEITTTDEHPVNLPYSRLDRDIVKKLKEMGIYGDDDIDDDASESIAKLLSGAVENSTN